MKLSTALSNEPHINRAFIQMFFRKPFYKHPESDWKRERRLRGTEDCICGLHVSNIYGGCLRCGGKVDKWFRKTVPLNVHINCHIKGK